LSRRAAAAARVAKRDEGGGGGGGGNRRRRLGGATDGGDEPQRAIRDHGARSSVQDGGDETAGEEDARPDCGSWSETEEEDGAADGRAAKKRRSSGPSPQQPPRPRRQRETETMDELVAAVDLVISLCTQVRGAAEGEQGAEQAGEESPLILSTCHIRQQTTTTTTTMAGGGVHATRHTRVRSLCRSLAPFCTTKLAHALYLTETIEPLRATPLP
jgi:hypothetical protein